MAPLHSVNDTAPVSTSGAPPVSSTTRALQPPARSDKAPAASQNTERPKTIAQVKLEQELEMKRRQEEADCSVRFVANKVRARMHPSTGGRHYMLHRACSAHCDSLVSTCLR